MGHKSIIDHDYLVFALKDVSVIIEQTIIAERFSSFTIKSRREVDFSNVGYYTPNFHKEDGTISEKNDELRERYRSHIEALFKNYADFVERGISNEDARFVLPYSFYSNIIMGVDAHTLLDMIIKYTKTKYAKVEEFQKFGEALYDIAAEHVPYIIPIIDAVPMNCEDEVSKFLEDQGLERKYRILDKPVLLNCSDNIDDKILIAALMRRYQFDYENAKAQLDRLSSKDESFRETLMRKIAFTGDRLELSQINFQFQIPISYAILTHITRHRTHKIVIPDFFPNPDLTQYKIPPKIKNSYLEEYTKIYQKNKEEYDYFKSMGIREEDLIYFTLSGNMLNIATNIDGWTLRHIFELRECNKAQWEIREICHNMHDEIRRLPHAKIFVSILGPTCETQKICNEGKESCGKINNIIKNRENI